MKPNFLAAKTFQFITLFLFLSTSVQAMEIEGVSFVDRYPAGQTELHLTGVAVLKWALLFDVYAGALYLPDGVDGEKWTDDVPKRLELFYFRDFKAEDFSSSSDKLLRESLAAEEYQSLAARLQEFYKLFRDIKSGDRYSLTYQPDIGTQLRLNGELLGGVPGADFAVAYFGIWLGPQPISAAFRDNILKGGYEVTR